MYASDSPDEGRVAGSNIEPGPQLAGRRSRPADEGPGLTGQAGRREDRITAAERSLDDAQRAVLAAGTDPDLVELAFAIARDCLAEAKACSELARRELALASYERLEARRRLLSASSSASSYASAPQPIVADMHGLSLCPDPTAARTVPEFIDVLRMYHVWAGKPSYRDMRRRINNRFGASTLHNALHSDKLPSLEMVQAIISACRGTEEHQRAYAAAWRLIAMGNDRAPDRAGGRTTRRRALYPISEPA
jgi:hypothetical protein